MALDFTLILLYFFCMENPHFVNVKREQQKADSFCTESQHTHTHTRNKTESRLARGAPSFGREGKTLEKGLLCCCQPVLTLLLTIFRFRLLLLLKRLQDVASEEVDRTLAPR